MIAQTYKHRVLFSGGRDYENHRNVAAIIKLFNPMDTLIIHGGARGADSLVNLYAKANNFDVQAYPVPAKDWREQGRAAGPLRNQRMFEESKPTQVVLFEGHEGTFDAFRRAKALGLPCFVAENGKLVGA